MANSLEYLLKKSLHSYKQELPKIQSATDNTLESVYYLPVLRNRCQSALSCILMYRLEQLFQQNAQGFYKFTSPCNNEKYHKGTSFTEELGVSSDEFRAAFYNIGNPHKSKSSFDDSDNRFYGQFYCSYYDRRSGLTHYFRNNNAVDEYLTSLSQS